MLQVFKCDYCSHFTQDAEGMRIHELKCKSNPNNKTCFTCIHSHEAGYPISGHESGCDLNLDCYKGEQKGNCSGWEHDGW